MATEKDFERPENKSKYSVKLRYSIGVGKKKGYMAQKYCWYLLITQIVNPFNASEKKQIVI